MLREQELLRQLEQQQNFINELKTVNGEALIKITLTSISIAAMTERAGEMQREMDELREELKQSRELVDEAAREAVKR